MASQEQARPCVICGKPQDERFRPFCSRRCADLDLAKWLRGEYSIPGAPLDEGTEPPPIEEDPELH